MDIEKQLEQIRRETEARCPKCNHLFDGEELGDNGLITFWAEDGPQEVECPNCEAMLVIEESVSRTYEVKEKGER